MSGGTVADGDQLCEPLEFGMGVNWFPNGSHPKEGARIDSNAVLENPTHAH